LNLKSNDKDEMTFISLRTYAERLRINFQTWGESSWEKQAYDDVKDLTSNIEFLDQALSKKHLSK